jgi:redox-sensitive bicupin YhaK (pirin superfamily)
MTITVRPTDARGHANHGWLDSKHSFSFANYFDPQHMGYRTLRVINEDVIEPGTGFGTHGHRDMEIITYIIRGTLEHKDSTGEHSLIQRGEVQRMSAGSGIRHSEYNASDSEDVKLLQIWLLPERADITPGYEQTLFPDEAKTNRLCLLAAPGGRDGALTIHQDVALYASILDAGAAVSLDLASGRGAWVQVVDGGVTVNGRDLDAGDAIAIDGETEVSVSARSKAEFLLFDLA